MSEQSFFATAWLALVLACGLGPAPAWGADESGRAAAPAVLAAELARDFRAPPDAAKPWAYWWWVKGNVTQEAITRDLEQMKQKGFGGLLLFDARGYHEDHTAMPPSRMDFMSPEWRRMFRFAVSEAGRVGLSMSVNLSSCAGALRGPWQVGDDAPKKLVWASVEWEGGKRSRVELPRGPWGRSWDVAVLAARHPDPAPGNTPVAVEVVDLTDRVDAEGKLAWEAPEGRWTLFRFACALMEGHENDVDILSPSAVEGHFQRMGKALLEDAGPWAGKTLTHFYSVSWEGATPTWTLGLEQHFQRYRGYNLRPWLPVLAGMTVKSRERSDRFLRDYHRTLSDCFMDHCYGRLRGLCGEAGLKWHSESGGPWDRKLANFKHADQLAFLGRNDMPQGEFWYPERAINRPAAIAAHIYGRPLAASEAFTHMRPHWSVYPALLKPLADAAFCDGVNLFIWHTFTCSPPEFGKPGIEYFAGTHLNPNVTWWEQSHAMLAYLARCQRLLREGKFVADVCCYTGDSPYLHWGRGLEWCSKPSLVLGKGYAFDLLNTEVLLDRLAAEGGRLVLPDGMEYRLLVVDLADETAPPEALEKIAGLAKAGATVVLGKRRPERAPGLKDHPACDEQVRRLANELWGEAGQSPGRRKLGKGWIVTGTSMDEALGSAGIAPDCEGPWDYIHRRAPGLDIYFLAGQGEADCTFRVQGKEPELWDPSTGQIRDAVCWRAPQPGRTLVPIHLAENGSVFVVFRRPAEPRHLVSVRGPQQGIQIEGRDDKAAWLSLWRQGRYVLRSAADRELAVQADDLPEPVALAGPWQVSFPPGWGAPASAVFDRLVPWNEHAQQGIRFFSGTATYRKSFSLSAPQARSLVRLQLGEVKHVAEVRLNGTPLGVVWSAPWSVDLTGVVKPGANQLEIDVTNVWVNRLVGDAGLPEAKRFTKTHVRREPDYPGRYAHLRGYAASDPLAPCGLLGPVRLEFGQSKEVAL